MGELKKEQKEAIKEFNKALQKIKKAGISIFGMDDALLYTTNEAIEEMRKIDPSVGKNYCDAADAHRMLSYRLDERTGSFETAGIYQDSGGW